MDATLTQVQAILTAKLKELGLLLPASLLHQLDPRAPNCAAQVLSISAEVKRTSLLEQELLRALSAKISILHPMGGGDFSEASRLQELSARVDELRLAANGLRGFYEIAEALATKPADLSGKIQAATKIEEVCTKILRDFDVAPVESSSGGE